MNNVHLHFAQMKRLEHAGEALRHNRMEAHVVETAAEVPPLVERLLRPGATVGKGGSATLYEAGVMDLLRSGKYNFLDTDAAGADKAKLYRAAFSADFYLASANALTDDGYIYEMDGNSNRVAALAFGPETVILVVGINKLVTDIPAARQRNFSVSAPANGHRLDTGTPCAITGKCNDCRSPGRMCCNELIIGPQRNPDRVKVILVGEALGF